LFDKECLNITSNQDIYKRNNQNQNSDAFMDSKTQTIGCYASFIEGSKIRILWNQVLTIIKYQQK